MKDFFTLMPGYSAEVAEEVEFSDEGHKEYRVVFNVYDRRSEARMPQKYTVFITRKHLLSTVNYGKYFYEDSSKAAIQYAKKILKSRCLYGGLSENAAYCRGKICEFTTLPEA